MTPGQLNRVTASVIEDLDTHAIDLLAKRYRRLLRRAGRHMARRVKANSYALTAAIVPPDEDEVIPHDLDDQVEKLTKAERAELVKLLVSAYEASEVAFDVRPSITPELLEKIGAHAAFAAENDLRSVYRDVISTAATEGYSITRTAGAIVEAVDGVAGYRATALARTDLIGLANGASMGIATEAFAERDDVTKVWLATEDDRTRDTHLDANGQEVALNEYFDVGGYSAMYPGDPDLPDEEVINCRCTVIYSGGGGGEQEDEAEGAAVASVHPYFDGMEWIWEASSPSFVLRAKTGYLDAVRQLPYAPDMRTQDQVTAAVTITVEDEASIEQRQRTPWEGILAIEGHPTSDRRYLIPGEIGERELPLPFAPSHDSMQGTETAGRIESIERIPVTEFAKDGWEIPESVRREGVVIWAEGSFDGSPESEDAIRQLENGVGVSLDLPIERQALIHAETFEEVDPLTLDDDAKVGMMFGVIPEGHLHGIGGKIGGVSLAAIAAFEETTIRVIGDRALVASGFELREREEPLVLVSLLEVQPSDALIASAAPIAPPRDWFFREEPDEPTPVTILSTGEVFFHLALWNTCHAGRANGAYSACMFAPHSRTNYSQFHLGAMLCEDGTEVPVGRITIGTGHAPLHLGAAAARKHYDVSGTCVAFGRIKDGVFGPYFCGVIKSDATAEQVRDLRACPPSGDWRAHDGALELQAALAVNVPAFPVPRSQLALSASVTDDGLSLSTLVLGAPTADDFREALQAEYGLLDAEGPDMLVDIGALKFELRQV